MNDLYQTKLAIEEAIKQRGLNPFTVRGKICLETGFTLGQITENTENDLEKVGQLKDAALKVLGIAL